MYSSQTSSSIATAVVEQTVLHLNNRFLQVEVSLTPFFELQSVTRIGDARNLANGNGHLMICDRSVIDLTETGRTILRRHRIAPADRLYSASGIAVELEYAIMLPDGGELILTRHLTLLDHAPALRWYDTYTSTSSLCGLYYSDLGTFQLPECTAVPTIVDFFGCTDQSNWRLREKNASSGKNRGCYFLCPGTDNNGLFFYKEGPLPDSQPIKGEYDFLWRPSKNGNSLSMVGLGFDGLHPDELRRANGVVIGLLEEAGSLLGLHRYHQTRYICNPEQEVEILANSWPAFMQDINEDKIRAELLAAAQAGITNLYIDDGWFEQFMGNIDRRKFPDGFTGLCKMAADAGINLGLWMNPLGLDSNLPEIKEWDGAECHDTITEGNTWNWLARTDDFRAAEYNPLGNGRGYCAIDLCHPDCFNYMRDRIIGIYLEYGIRRFKFDLYQLSAFNTLRGDANIHYEVYRRLLHELKTAIPGLVISMDITRRNRPGFDFGLDYGRLFLENRGRRLHDYRYYHPYVALRNLWSTLKYAPACKLETEMMPQIDDYPLDYILGTGLFANPLYWGSLTELSGTKAEAMKAFYAALASSRREIMTQLIFPAGEMPDCGNWSAIISISPDYPQTCHGYFGIYRNGAENDLATINLPLFSGKVLTVALVHGAGHAEWINDRLEVSCAEKYSFQLYSFSANKNFRNNAIT